MLSAAACLKPAADPGGDPPAGPAVPGGTDPGDDPGTDPGTDPTPVDPSKYAPNVTAHYNGTVNVAMVFGNNLPGWQAMVTKYSEYQPGVTVNLNNKTDGEYVTFLTNDLNSASGQTDIFQGNSVNTLLETRAYDMYRHVGQKNQYIDAVWGDVLERDAYITAGQEGTTYIMNSNSLATAWFYNADALAEADVNPEAFKTWDDLMDACAAMKAAGWTNPLGLGGNRDAVLARHFSWLLRVYGDQYWRDQYENIQYQAGDFGYNDLLGGYTADLNAMNPETDPLYNVSELRLWKGILDENYSPAEKYVGPKSAKFAEFWNNMLKMKPYLSPAFSTTSYEQAQENFLKNDKDNPVFFLEVLGFAAQFPLLIADAAAEKQFTIGAFDYLPMQGDYVKTQFVRDVGGNGGYISVRGVNRDAAANARNLDFVRFIMSRVGQAAFFAGLEAGGKAPDGVPTVKYVEMPDVWKPAFENPKIKWNGLCDNNSFITSLVSGISANDLQTANFNGIGAMFAGTQELSAFQNDYAAAVLAAGKNVMSGNKWREDAWKTPQNNPKA
jgi:ABC-type glycerol-3-phosphate transport system substrate-binding protein